MKSDLKSRVIALRKNGSTYGEIQNLIGKKIPKSTLSYWCSAINFTAFQLNRVEELIRKGGERGRAIALAVSRKRRHDYLNKLLKNNAYLRKLTFTNKRIAKVVLAVLYLCEGGKRQSGSLMFGNSDPRIINLFLELMQMVYEIDTRKFRCTVQCRADHDTNSLNRFWSKITNVPLSQFYKPRIDARTIGMKSRRKDYKGVCRIDYLSANVYNDLLAAGDIIAGNKVKKSGPMV